MSDFTQKLGFWAAVIFGATGLGMLIVGSGRRQTPGQWASQAGVDPETWFTLAVGLLVGGLVLLAICRWPTHK